LAADRAIAGAPAQVAVQLVVDLPGLAEVVAVVALEHRDDEAGRAVAALRAVVLDHRGLHRVQRLARADALDGDDLAPGHHRQERDAAVDRPVGGLAAGGALDDRDRAGPAIALRAAFLAAGVPVPAQVAQQRGRRRLARDGHDGAVEGELEAG
jgi:hypothetical protein